MENLPSEFFTPQSILTLTGATGAVYVVSAGLQHAFNFNPRWLALVISLVLALVGAHTTQPHELGTYLIAVVNGFLIYCTAVGVSSIAGTPAGGGGVSKGALSRSPSTPAQRTFRSRWF